MRKLTIISGLLSIVLFTGCKKEISSVDSLSDTPVSAASNSTTATDEAAGQFASDRVLVKFKKGVAATGREKAFAQISGHVKEKIRTKIMEESGDEGFYVVNTSLPVLDAVDKMKGLADVEYAEPDYLCTTGATATDPYFANGSLWGMSSANAFGSQAPKAWTNNHTGSSSILVGIIDEGVQFTHPDLAANIWTNPYDPIDGIDNDANGYIDDIHGWDFANNDNSVYDGGTISSATDAHGTHVAGTIGAVSNGSGVVGVNWNVTMIPCKFLSSGGGYTSNAVKALDYLTNLKKKYGLNIVASNNSWGGGGFSQTLVDAIERSNAQNILFVAAAGNGGADQKGDNNDVFPNYPSNYPNANIIAVASITSTGALSSFSNYGSKTVDIAAPGSGIISTVPYNAYANYSGTSMATPHVTGAVALYASTHATATAAQIKTAILNSGTSTNTLNKKCVSGKRLNVSTF